VVSRDELDALQADPPEWLRELRRNGPHPRQVVADRLGVSISGLARAEITEPLTTAQIVALKEEQPEWLRRERKYPGRGSARGGLTAGRAVRERSRRSGRAMSGILSPPSRRTRAVSRDLVGLDG
jgi:hypothetical protein